MLFSVLSKVAGFLLQRSCSVLETKSFLPALAVWGKGRSKLARGIEGLTDTAKLIAQLNAIWKARSPRISA